MAHKLLLLAPLIQGGGNLTTICRIKSHLEPFFECFLNSAVDFSHPEKLHKFIEENNVVLVIAIHAYKSGHLLLDCPAPYVTIFGGTDVNENYKDEGKFNIMTKVVSNANAVIGFSQSVIEQASLLWDEDSMRLFTLVAGIRPVKNPLFLAKAFSEWHLNGHKDVLFVIIGPAIDGEFAQKFVKEVRRFPGLFYIPGLSSENTHAAIKDSFAVVNSSNSEGMSAAILEAMDLNVPVIARNIPGNVAMVTHKLTGLLYHTPQEFIELSQQLLTDQDWYSKLVVGAKDYVSYQHSMERERSAYTGLANSILSISNGK